MLFVENVVAGSVVNPPGRISGVLANAPFDVMQVSRVNAPLRHVKSQRGRSGGAVTAAGNVREALSLFREPLEQMGPCCVCAAWEMLLRPDNLPVGKRNYCPSVLLGFSSLRQLFTWKASRLRGGTRPTVRLRPLDDPHTCRRGTKGFAWTDKATVAWATKATVAEMADQSLNLFSLSQ